jgi:DNA polymerase-3 subunit delta'
MYLTLKKAQPRALRIIENSINNNRLSHAYLFTGPEGTYKKEMAYHFALSLYCKEKEVCYKCPSCLSILENRHMNVYYIEPMGQTVRKEQILSLQDEFSKTSLLPGPRIYIINDADTMTASAANSLLKFIEEPVNEETYGILITKHKDNMLSTIISRSMVINFDQIDKNHLKEELAKKEIDLVLTDSITVMTSNIVEANSLAVDVDFTNVVNIFQKFVNQLCENKPIALFYRANSDVLNKERLKSFLILLESFYRDIYEYQINKNILTFTSLSNEITKISSLISSEDVLKYLFQILELIKKSSYNVNMSLLMNQFLIDMNGGF